MSARLRKGIFRGLGKKLKNNATKSNICTANLFFFTQVAQTDCFSENSSVKHSTCTFIKKIRCVMLNDRGQTKQYLLEDTKFCTHENAELSLGIIHPMIVLHEMNERRRF
jgi:hypothetical protein